MVVIAYLALSINTYLETQVFGVFSLGYGRFGPTEARVGLIVLNLALLAGATGVLDIAGLAIAGLMLVGLGVRAARNLRVLPDVERLGEAMDVLGDAQLADPPLLRHRAVALGVARREVLGGGGAVVVGAEVDVVVGQHGRVILRAHHARGLALCQRAQVAGGAHDQPDEHQARDREAGDVEDARRAGEQRQVERDQADAGYASSAGTRGRRSARNIR